MENKKWSIWGFFKSVVQFVKIVILFFIMLHLLYWVQHLLNSNWNWMNFAHPVLDFFVATSGKITEDSIDILGTIFEYKYIIAVILYIVVYFSLNFVNIFIDEMEYRCDDVKRFAKKIEEDSLNRTLSRQQAESETKINKYKIFVKTSIKQRFSHKSFGYNLEELTRDMNRYLMEKTDVKPDLFEDGFLYSFGNFKTIDKVLDIFGNLIKSEAPLDYVICVQVYEGAPTECLKKIQHLAEIGTKNKITMLSDTAYRYTFNDNKRYKTSQLGTYQIDNNTIEICEFVLI